jgi:hypothetical protein
VLLEVVVLLLPYSEVQVIDLVYCQNLAVGILKGLAGH